MPKEFRNLEEDIKRIQSAAVYWADTAAYWMEEVKRLRELVSPGKQTSHSGGEGSVKRANMNSLVASFLSEKEKEVLSRLAAAWNTYVDLHNNEPDSSHTDDLEQAMKVSS